MSVIATVREALRGSQQDFPDGPIGRSLVLLAVPMVLETVLESLFAVVDIFFVAHLGADAIATVGLTESMESLVYALPIAPGIGATAPRAAPSLVLGVRGALPIALVGIRYAPQLLAALGGSETVQREGTGFT